MYSVNFPHTMIFLLTQSAETGGLVHATTVSTIQNKFPVLGHAPPAFQLPCTPYVFLHGIF
jgi:hypothetical protein